MSGGNVLQVYLILDEFIMGGEIQETSKKVRPGHLRHLWRATLRLTEDLVPLLPRLSMLVNLSGLLVAR